jgi:hypothetical protein
VWLRPVVRRMFAVVELDDASSVLGACEEVLRIELKVMW